ncbi:MAG: HypC/HybG/HupF family hydrogenase formation chaperone [Candidatus Dormibacteraeota bacterium]|nr:HypC/HybG/HupF family hydrogenase formation chaperone [Candidatus Dormibacteraeota bacterium]
MCLAIPVRLIDYTDDQRQYGKVELGGVVRLVNTTMLTGNDSAEPGEYVLVHVGFALSKVSEEEAAQTLALLEAMGEVFSDEVVQFTDSEALAAVIPKDAYLDEVR